MLTDADIALRILNFEDNFVERKSIGDNKRWMPALVAFANSAPSGLRYKFQAAPRKTI
jgi:hypothetical protein